MNQRNDPREAVETRIFPVTFQSESSTVAAREKPVSRSITIGALRFLMT